MAINAAEIEKALLDLSNANLAQAKDGERAKRFFKTGVDEYAEGETFLGIQMPVLRKLAKQFNSISLSETQKLLRSNYHEERMLALLILTEIYIAGDDKKQERVYQFYLKNTRYINNWDLVDVSAYKILGEYLLNHSRDVLLELAKSSDWWERRIAMVSTYQLIRQNQYKDTLKLAKLLLKDPEDLVQKAVGWMLREVGNRDRLTEQHFLDKYYKSMPRTMLRYAIEKFPQPQRKAYLHGTR